MAQPWKGFSIKESDYKTRDSPFHFRVHQITGCYHVAHTSDVVEIFDSGVVRGTKEQSAWFSTNWWEPGSIYGTVSFSFNFPLFHPWKLYWLQHIEKGRQSVLEFILTEGQQPLGVYPCEPVLIDPTQVGTPLYLSGDGLWYCLISPTYEFRVEKSIPISECIGIDSIKHNSQYCAKSKSAYCTANNNHDQARLYVMAIGLNDQWAADRSQLRSRSYELGYSLARALIGWLADRDNPGVWSSTASVDWHPFQDQFTQALQLLRMGQFSDAEQLIRSTGANMAFAKYISEMMEKSFGEEFGREFFSQIRSHVRH